MSEQECTHDCSSCGVEGCGERAIEKLSTLPSAHVKKIIAVISGKGGVGKSLVSSLLAKELAEKGYKVGVLDADVTGPSIPKAFGAYAQATGDEEGIYPVESRKGMPLISVNSLLEDTTEPIIWRGSLISNFVGQLFSQTYWGDLDFMVIDMPPGTGDVPLTVFQQIPVDGCLIVSTPQDLVSLIVSKSVKMAQMMNVKTLGLVTNMAYVKCPDCGKKIFLYGEPSYAVADSYNLTRLDEIGIDPNLAKMIDQGDIEEYPTPLLEKAVQAAIDLLK